MSADGAVVVGGGLAGLACARHLTAAGVPCTVLEASDGLGGRARTDEVDGFLLDRGFQVFLTAYPEAGRVLDLPRLELREFYPGALVRADGAFHRVADPFRRPLDAARALRAPVYRLRDLRARATMRARARSGTVEALLSRRDRPAIEALRELGLSDRIVERFFRPFLGGVFLDRELATSSRMLEFVVRMFSQVYAALPAAGMGALARQLADGLPPGTVRLAARVSAVHAGAVVLESGEHVEARAVVVATGGDTAAQLAPDLAAPPWLGGCTIYYAAERAPVEGPYLVLDGDGDGPVNELAVVSEVAPSYAPDGQALVSASVVGVPDADDVELERRVRVQLRAWFGDAVDGWRHLRTYRIEHALPARLPPALEPVDRRVRFGASLFVCGDHRDTASIEGALVSGRRAAQSLIEELRRR